ncbi:hypothetical protein D9C73_009539 [Collichthys lucidus]|uniref:Uncharacterized protein n=1 Tax=Collichthys lucidus TaxID=240159 RepID=A0A4U5UNE9_COLLU|nr:hypothetical protein D9C73_009539 [Collichthys lucidus]
MTENHNQRYRARGITMTSLGLSSSRCDRGTLNPIQEGEKATGQKRERKDLHRVLIFTTRSRPEQDRIWPLQPQPGYTGHV